MKARDWLVKQGLAKQGRGRFSREAKAALAKAISEGMSFSDFKLTGDEAPKVQRVAEFRTATPVVVDRQPFRTQKVVWAVDKGTKPSHAPLVVTLDSCAGCSKSISYCGCSSGPKLPKYLGGGVALLSKPII